MYFIPYILIIKNLLIRHRLHGQEWGCSWKLLKEHCALKRALWRHCVLRPFSPPVYGASAYYEQAQMEKTDAARQSARQDFVSMGRKDKRVMMTSVWSPGMRTLQHPQKARSNVYLTRGSASRGGIVDPAFAGGSTFHGVASDIRQNANGLIEA